eukprot:1135418-Alexandrium_andersonii.AAC.1
MPCFARRLWLPARNPGGAPTTLKFDAGQRQFRAFGVFGSQARSGGSQASALLGNPGCVTSSLFLH